MNIAANHVVQLILFYKYPLIVLVTVVEGPIIMTLSGFLLKFGYLSILPTYVSLMLGDLIGDVWWYGVGRFAGTGFIARFGKYFSITKESVAPIERVFHKHKNFILFISKITMGFGFALVTLITAGLVRIPFRRYLTINFLGQFLWTAFLMYLGYSFGNFYLQASSVIEKLSVVGLLVIAFVCLLGLGKYLGRRFVQREQV